MSSGWTSLSVPYGIRYTVYGQLNDEQSTVMCVWCSEYALRVGFALILKMCPPKPQPLALALALALAQRYLRHVKDVDVVVDRAEDNGSLKSRE